MGLFSTTHIHKTGNNYVPYEKSVTINEHRAPTDKLVELLNEFQEKAYQNIIDKIYLRNSIIEACVVYYQSDVSSFDIRFALKFKINGVEIKHEGRIDRDELMDVNAYSKFRSQLVLDFFHRKFAEAISLELIKYNQEHEFIRTLTK